MSLVGVLAMITVVPGRLQSQRAVRCAPSEQIRSVTFKGSPVFDDFTLASSIVTHEPALKTRLLHIGDRPCVDTLELRRDALRLAVLHRQAGWYRAIVNPEIKRHAGDGGIGVEFTIIPGREAVLDSLEVSGLPDTVPGRKPFSAPLTALIGRRFDRPAVDSAIVLVLDALHNSGFARAAPPRTSISIDSASASVRLELEFDTGRPLSIGTVVTRVEPVPGKEARVDSTEVMNIMGVSRGDAYSAARLLEAQRALYRSEAFRLVLLDTITMSGPNSDSLIGLQVSVAEAQTRSARAGAGWATLDCIRAQGRLMNRGFLGVGRRLEISARASKIGVGDPLDQVPALCAPSVRKDLFSQRLNYYVGATLSNTNLFGWRIAPVVTLYSERRSEPFAYLRETSIGSLLELNKQFTSRVAGTFGLQYENGRTDVDPVISCTRFGQCQPEEIVLSRIGRGIGIANFAGSWDRTNDPVNPSAGWRIRGDERAGIAYSDIVSTLKFYRSTVEVSAFTRAARGVFGIRVQGSGVFAPGADLVDGTPLLPQQERLYVGGQNSVRGFQQNLLGPVVYVVSKVDTVPLPDGSFGVEVPNGGDFDRAVPRGGTAMLVANVEYRRSFRFLAEQLQFVTFVDAGTLWETSSKRFEFKDLRFTPGAGLRIVTPLGPFRVDVGYRPYAAASGRALYITPKAAGGSDTQSLFYCASPRTDPAGNYGDVLSCPATFRPREGRTFLSRLVFHFGLGQAF